MTEFGGEGNSMPQHVKSGGRGSQSLLGELGVETGGEEMEGGRQGPIGWRGFITPVVS